MSHNKRYDYAAIGQWIREFYETNGVPASVRDISMQFDISSTSAAHYILQRLVENGVLRQSRGFYLPVKPKAGPGFARFSASDTPESVEAKMSAAFAPVDAIVATMRKVLS